MVEVEKEGKGNGGMWEREREKCNNDETLEMYKKVSIKMEEKVGMIHHDMRGILSAWWGLW